MLIRYGCYVSVSRYSENIAILRYIDSYLTPLFCTRLEDEFIVVQKKSEGY